nr:cytochrome P450 2B11-like [Ciona intestinalis]|eukprot:XP_002121048.1 cytochrome P450 2B11-like [Ciona intestinalis]
MDVESVGCLWGLYSSWVTTCLMGLLTLVILVYYYWWKLPHPRYPPGVRGIPVMGATPFFGKYPQETLARWSRDKYGPIMSARFGQDEAVVLNDFETMHEAFVKNLQYFNSRPTFQIVEQYTNGYGFGFADGHKKFLEVRTFSQSALRGLGIGKRTMEARVSEVAQDLVRTLEDLDQKATDVKMVIGTVVANVISSVAFGKTYDPGDAEFEHLVQCSFNCYGDPDNSEHVNFLIFYPAMRHIQPFKRSLEKFYVVQNGILDFCRKEILEHKKNLDENEPGDYIDAFLVEMKKHSPQDSWFHEKQLQHAVVDLFIAGTETSTNTILWALLALIHYPETQEKLYQELLENIGEQVLPSIDQRDKLPLFRAFIQEIFRFKTLVPLSVTHRASDDVEIGGYVIPKGTKVFPNIHAVHHDPNIWKNPSEFNIYRHIDKDGKFIPSKKVIPFGIGCRSCLGEKLARIEIFLFLANIIKRFKVLPDPKSQDLPEFKDGVNSIIYVPYRYKVVAKPRIVNE